MSEYQHLRTELCVSRTYFKTRLLNLVLLAITNTKDIYARLNSTVQEKCSHTGSYNMFSDSIQHHVHSSQQGYDFFILHILPKLPPACGATKLSSELYVYTVVIPTYQVRERSPCTGRKQDASYGDVRSNECTVLKVGTASDTHEHVTDVTHAT